MEKNPTDLQKRNKRGSCAAYPCIKNRLLVKERKTMFGKKKKESLVQPAETQEKPAPAYLREDYPYQAVGEAIADLDALELHGVIYEIKCKKCEMSIRSQGCNIKSTFERLMAGSGCIGCGNKELAVRRVDTSSMPPEPAAKAE